MDWTFISWIEVSDLRKMFVLRYLLKNNLLAPGEKPATHWENFISRSFQIEWDMIMVTVFLSIWNQMDFHLVQNRKENCHHDHIPFNVKGNGNEVFEVHGGLTRRDP